MIQIIRISSKVIHLSSFGITIEIIKYALSIMFSILLMNV